MQTNTPDISSAELREFLELLLAERALVKQGEVATDPEYVADLEHEIVATEHAYVGAAVTEIAALRASLSGRLAG